MKKIILFFIIVFTIFYGCSKKGTVTPPPADNTDKVAPSVPTGITGVTTSSSVTLYWQASTDNVGVKSYSIYRTGMLVTTVTGTSYTDASLVANTDYAYTIAATDAAGNASAQSTSVTFHTLVATTIATVTTTSSSSSTTSNTTFTVTGSVTADGGATTTAYAVRKWYQDADIVLGIVPGFRTDSVSIGTGIGVYTYTWTNAVPGTVYTTYISAKNAVGVSKGVDKSATTAGFHVGQDLTTSMNIPGIVFETHANADKAYVAAKADENPGIGLRWWDQGGPYFFLGAFNETMGGGLINTTTIATHPQCAVNSAARRCYDKPTTNTKQSKWWLPNTPEWIVLKPQQDLPGLAGTWVQYSAPIWNNYWSSNEQNSNVLNARGSTSLSGPVKDAPMGVRAICEVFK